MMYLRMKINESIINEFLRILHILKNYSDLLKHFINIKLHLRETSVLLKITDYKTEKNMFQKKS